MSLIDSWRSRALPVDPAAMRRRAAWMLAIVIPAPSLGAAMAFFVAPGLVGNACYAIGKTLLYGIPLAILLLGDGHDAIRPDWPNRGRTLLFGVALGLLMAATVFVAAHVASQGLQASTLSTAIEAAGVATPLRFALLAAYLCLVNSLLEEVSFRWFLVTRLRLFVGPAPAAILASLAFTAHHVVVLAAFFPLPLALGCALATCVGGIAWSWFFLRFGSIWPAWISHVLVDAAIMVVAWRTLFGG